MKNQSTKLFTVLLVAGSLGAFAGCNKDTSTTETPAGPVTTTTNADGNHTAGQYIDDTAITAKVKSALAGDSAVKSSDISVTTNQGVVTLAGTVDNSDQKSAAGKDAGNVAGVKDVTNTLNTR
jgi:hyperosmotically inducible protein